MILSSLSITAADAFGAAAFAGSCLWPLMKQRRGLLWGQAITNLLFITHYVLLGAYTAAALCGLVVTQVLMSLPEQRSRWQSLLFTATLPGIAAVAAATWAGLPSALSSIGISLSTAARWQSNTTRMRLFLLGAGLFWISHNILVMSPFAIASDVCSAVGNIARLIGERCAARRAAARAAINGNDAPTALAA
ncbi:YgjV family protein [Azospirillum griseum]|uniref:YgjV family protein n=1 Tax=Azospirillum griseum TaxID=2496639 RepID=A0A431VDG6_9PROT|nr:YgjV family protein [Azospirillum griseum]RTR17243.1 YgjV family protein [Azospirillum griseum]